MADIKYFLPYYAVKDRINIELIEFNEGEIYLEKYLYELIVKHTPNYELGKNSYFKLNFLNKLPLIILCNSLKFYNEIDVRKSGYGFIDEMVDIPFIEPTFNYDYIKKIFYEDCINNTNEISHPYIFSKESDLDCSKIEFLAELNNYLYPITFYNGNIKVGCGYISTTVRDMLYKHMKLNYPNLIWDLNTDRYYDKMYIDEWSFDSYFIYNYGIDLFEFNQISEKYDRFKFN